MVKFLGSPLDIPDALTATQAVRKAVTDALATRVTSLESSTASSAGLTVVTKTAAYTAVASNFVLANATSAAFTVTLPSGPTAGTRVAVKKIDTTTNAVTVVGSNSTTIDGDPSCVLAAPQVGAVFFFDGSNWQIQSVALFDAGGQNLTFRGAYSTSTAYAANDVVYYLGNAYIALVANTNVAPTVDASSATWNLLVLHGATGSQGSAGATGSAGTAATVTIGTVNTGAAGSSASVTNSGTTAAAILNFSIPQGATGATGATGSQGPTGATGSTGATGPAGPGVASGGSTNYILRKNSATSYDTAWTTEPIAVSSYGNLPSSAWVGMEAVSTDYNMTWIYVFAGGTFSWVPLQSCLMVNAYQTSGQSVTTSGSVLVCGVSSSSFGGYSTSTGVFTAPFSGWYEFTGTAAFVGDSTTYRQCYWAKNGSTLNASGNQITPTNASFATVLPFKTQMVWLNVSATMTPYVLSGTATTTLSGGTVTSGIQVKWLGSSFPQSS